MKINNKNLLLVVLVISVLALPFSLSDRNDFREPKLVDDSSIGYYQSTTCGISFVEVLSKNINNTNNLYFNNNAYPGTECFGKVTGLDKVENVFIVSIGTNPSVNLLLQSVLYFLIFLLIKPKERSSFFNESLILITLRSGLLSLLFTFQHFSEARFYERTNKYFLTDSSVNNYYLLGIFLIYFLIFLGLTEVANSRESVLLNYLPYAFLFVGTFVGTNMNLYILILCFFGLKGLFMKKYNFYINIIYGLFSVLWITFNYSSDNFFDADKLRGYTNSANNDASLYFWIITFYLLLNGFYYLYTVSQLNLDKFKQSLIYSGAGVVILGFLGAIYPSINFINFFFFGQNKRGMKELDSIAGNTWRGFSASAESIGEFFAFIILFYVLFYIKKNISLTKADYVLLPIVGYGLLKSNNFAAILSLIIFTTIFIVNKKILNPKYRNLIFGGLFFSSLVLFIFYVVSFNYEFLSTGLLYEISLHSNFFTNSDNYINFLNIEKYFNEKDLGTLLLMEDNSSKASSSYLFLVNLFTTKINIPLIPNIVAFISMISIFINRTEMWGIFFAKYSPTIGESLFGSGPLQISEYLYRHPVRLDVPPEKLQSLFLPHSSIFDVLVFYGLIGLLLMSFFIFRIFYNRKYIEKDAKYLLGFLLINMVKSDSILYISSTILIFLIIFMIIEKKEEYV
tara:strand:- start:1610 stop:3652 length:2043 start_codon:yes stop_codon:yes gene_type:complete